MFDELIDLWHGTWDLFLWLEAELTEWITGERAWNA